MRRATLDEQASELQELLEHLHGALDCMRAYQNDVNLTFSDDTIQDLIDDAEAEQERVDQLIAAQAAEETAALGRWFDRVRM